MEWKEMDGKESECHNQFNTSLLTMSMSTERTFPFDWLVDIVYHNLWPTFSKRSAENGNEMFSISFLTIELTNLKSSAISIINNWLIGNNWEIESEEDDVHVHVIGSTLTPTTWFNYLKNFKKREDNWEWNSRWERDAHPDAVQRCGRCSRMEMKR